MKQTKGMSDQETGLAKKQFVDLDGETRDIPNGAFQDGALKETSDNPAGFDRVTMGSINKISPTHPIEKTKFSPRRQ